MWHSSKASGCFTCTPGYPTTLKPRKEQVYGTCGPTVQIIMQAVYALSFATPQG